MIKQNKRGQALTEFAIALPLFVLLTFGMMGLGYVLFFLGKARVSACQGAVWAAGNLNGTMSRSHIETETKASVEGWIGGDRSNFEVSVHLPVENESLVTIKVLWNLPEFIRKLMENINIPPSVSLVCGAYAASQ